MISALIALGSRIMCPTVQGSVNRRGPALPGDDIALVVDVKDVLPPIGPESRQRSAQAGHVAAGEEVVGVALPPVPADVARAGRQRPWSPAALAPAGPWGFPR